ncbi:MAG: phosphatidylserine decarboxylase family protein [Mariprofundaceae bacterium]|nr:phosphatidylserine decarboxylase family protein [Mariprofundaceae bacterium]
MSKLQPIPGRPRGKLPFAPEGWPFIIPTLLLLLLSVALCWWIPAVAAGLLLAFMVNFFRDPERRTPEGGGLFICPADGKVIRADADESGVYVDIFMNVFDVHVNRAPMSGRITHMQYFPGNFINASFEHAGEENERNRFEMATEDGGRIAFTQIAGLVARRIVSYVAVGDQVRAGQRIGMIRFGSRVNCEIPAGYELCVKPGDKVVAGKSIIARKAGA